MPKMPELSSPPSDPSPKRKRSNSSADLQVNTQLQTHIDEATEAAAVSSPRTKVAEKFRDLELRQPIQQPTYSQGTAKKHVARRKRIKREELLKTADFPQRDDDDGVVIQETPQPSFSSPSPDDDPFTNNNPEVAETPDCYPPRSSSPTPLRKAPDPLPPDSTSVFVPRTERLLSPPPPHSSTLLSASSNLSPGSCSPLPSARELSPNQAALTWQESEITGHLLDPSSGDDGEGINGVGFRPTPAIAYARQQRRRQQVSEWKAREAKEERRKRIERRRGNVPLSKGDVLMRRSVRFELES